jgi:voltage-gated potassium channel
MFAKTERSMMDASRRVLGGIVALVAIIIVGVIGYEVIEGWSFLDALFMTITTITTVGYSEVHPLSTGGQIFTIFLIVGGVGGALYALTGIMEYIIAGYFRTTLGRRRMRSKIAQLKGHFVLCGFGRVGAEIARTFREEGVPFVIVERDPQRIAQIDQAGYLYVQGDATSDKVLREAGIEHARGLVAAVGTDTDNTYITLSARGLCPDLFIESRANDLEAEMKLKRAGADRVASPHSVGGRRMAMLALRPAVVDFIDTVISRRGREMQLESVLANRGSPLVGLTLKAARSGSGIAILAMQKKDGRLLPNPRDSEIIEEDDRLIVIGTDQQLGNLEETLRKAKPSEIQS